MSAQTQNGISRMDTVPFRAGFLAGPLEQPEGLSLAGSRCTACGIALFGQRHRCENCSSATLDPVTFAGTGVVHTYTIQRYAPPPPHSLPTDPWQPRPVAWVDLDDNGPRILGPLTCLPDAVWIGMKVAVECHVAWHDAQGRPVIAYRFSPLAQNGTAA